MKEEWKEYYLMLETIRESGIVNMYGAAPYLASCCDIDEKLAKEVLLNWMQNYNEIAKKYYN